MLGSGFVPYAKCLDPLPTYFCAPHTELWPKIKSKNRKPVYIFAMRFLHTHLV